MKLMYFIVFLLYPMSITSQLMNETKTISNNFSKVIDAASARYTASKEWKQFLESKNFVLSVPDCSTVPQQFPTKFVFPRNYLNLCYDMEAFGVWPSIYEKSGQLMVQAIKEQYGLDNFTAIFKKVTTVKGYFNELRKVVDNGECDMSLSATMWTDERKSQVHFQCANGKTFPAFLRSGLQNDSVTLTSEKDLDNEKVIVVVSQGTVYESYAKTNLKKAKVKVIEGYKDAWEMIVNQTVHVFVANSVDLFLWMGANKNSSCPNCSLKVFGSASNYGTFISNQIGLESSAIKVSNNSITILLVIVIILTNLT